jgi:hypothetical protein
MKKCLTLLALALLSANIFSQEIVSTRLRIGLSRLEARELGDQKIQAQFVISPTLVTSNGSEVPLTSSLKMQMQIGVWIQSGSQSTFGYLENVKPQIVEVYPMGRFVQKIIFSKSDIMTNNAPICIQVIGSTQVGAGESMTPAIVCSE